MATEIKEDLIFGFRIRRNPFQEREFTFTLEVLTHRYSSLLLWKPDLAIDDGIVKTRLGRGRGRCRIINIINSSPVDGSKTHGTRFARGVDVTPAKGEIIQFLCRKTNSHDLGMRRRIMVGSNTVARLGNDLAITNDNRPKGSPAIVNIGGSQVDGTL